MTLARRLLADESGLSRLAWVAAIALAAVLGVHYRQELLGIIQWLRDLGLRLAGGAIG